ncbi:hypothetical protein CJ030_MR0G005451 [Morella rubra]|uniref:RNase H type-1 domain-containing protein n=1 Tax=Morella rubra TaxID=262757 RepID=A0A6A1ULB2_9ROSI|nr:hypothetical protein CJ030_MR0G005451 [Morella rubra]
MSSETGGKTTNSLLRQGCCFQISSGSEVRVWLDQWLPNAELFFPSPRDSTASVDVEFKVQELFIPGSRAWDEIDDLVRYGASLMDVIWLARNQALHHGKREVIGTTIRRIHWLYFEHSEAWAAVAPPKKVVWLPPCGNRWKINFDVAIRSTCSFLAAVCRDASDSILFAWTKRIPPSTPLVGEANVVLFAVRETCLLGYPLVDFKGDNL